MNERMISIRIPSYYPGSSAALGDNYAYLMFPYDLTIIYVSCAPSANEADGTIDINDDGSAAISAITCATAATPGEWQSTHAGGSETPVFVAAGSKLSFDANSFSNGIEVIGHILGLVGEITG